MGEQSLSLEEMASRQKEFVKKGSEEPQIVVRKYQGQWYAAAFSVPPNHNLGKPYQGALLMIDEDSGKVERKDSLVDIQGYITDELGTQPLDEAPQELQDRINDLRQ